MSQPKEENGQPTSFPFLFVGKENSATEDNSQDEDTQAPQDEEVDSHENSETEENSKEDENTPEEVDEEDEEGTEEPPQSEVEDIKVSEKKKEKKQRPASVDPQKKFVADVPKEEPKQLKTSQDIKKKKANDRCCCGKVPWSRWEELVINYIHIVIGVSSGLAGAGLSTIAKTFEDTLGGHLNITTPGALNVNLTSCSEKGYLSDDIEIIVTVIYTVIVALFLAQVITLIVLGSKRKYIHAEFVFALMRALITMFTTVYFIIGWTGALGCVSLNPFAIFTTVLEVGTNLNEIFKQITSLGKEFKTDYCPQQLPDDDPLDVM